MSKRDKLLAIARRRGPNPAACELLPELPGVSAVPRRRVGLWSLKHRIYVPCPLELKTAIERIARQHGLTQAELGLLIIEAAVLDQTWLVAVIAKR
jgi:hypothetical protein